MKKIAEDIKGIKIYLFGSALTKLNPGDIDLLFVYSEEAYSIESILALRRRVTSLLSNSLNKEIDIILLSDKEILSNSFIEDEGAIVIYG